MTAGALAVVVLILAIATIGAALSRDLVNTIWCLAGVLANVGALLKSMGW